MAHLDYEDRIREIRLAEQKGLGLIAKEPVALAVCRSFGDRDFKPISGSKEIVTAIPEVTCLRLNRSHKFIALVCDGIPDIMQNEEILSELDFGRDPDPVADTKAACANLVNEAYKRGSGDNVTVVMARFQWETIQAHDLFMEALPVVRPKGKPCPSPGFTAAAALKRKLAEDTDASTGKKSKAAPAAPTGVVVVKATPSR